jgi:hypothetical protein
VAESVEAQPGDGYVRVAGGQMRDWWRPQPVRGSVVFVDLAAEGEDTEAVRASIRAIPGGAIVNAQWLLIRVPDDLRNLSGAPGEPDIGSLADGAPDLSKLARDLEQRVAEQGIEAPIVGLVRFPVGAPPVIAWSREHGSGTDDGTLLHRARRAELSSLLDAQEAVSTPSSYHYRLPSGHHSASFVRVGDLFRDLRAAHSLSTWLRAALSIDGQNVVVLDTGSIAPLASELDAALRLSGAGRIMVVALDEYPESQFEYRRALAPAAGPDGAPPPTVLCVLSVESTGVMGERIAQALQLTAGPDAWRVEPLISRRDREASAVPLEGSMGTHQAWLALGARAGTVGPSDVCKLCVDPARARLVTIDPRNFSAKSLPEPDLLMPLLGDGRHNRSLWNRYHDLQPEQPDGCEIPSVSFAGRTRMLETDRQRDDGTYFEPATLVVADFPGLLRHRLEELRQLPPLGSGSKLARMPAQIAALVDRIQEPDIVVLDHEDIEALVAVMPAGATDADALGLLEAGFAALRSDGVGPQVVVVSGDPEQRAAVLRPIARGTGPDERIVLLFALGLRLGVTLQRLVVDVHNAWRVAERSPNLRGLVVHAHPEDSRAWSAIGNTFRHAAGPDLLALWLTHLPHRSPLEEERALLEQVDELPEDEAGLLAARVSELSLGGRDGSTVRPFWSDGVPTLRRTSYYGDVLGDRSTLAAVGAAMQRARLVHRPMGSPFWYRFDLPKIFRSYFDGLIHVAVLRWLEPREGWWGATANDQEELISELKGQAPPDWPLVLAELLLAAVQGKVPAQMHLRLLAEVEVAGKDPHIPFTPAQKAWVELGAALVRAERTTPPGSSPTAPVAKGEASAASPETATAGG